MDEQLRTELLRRGVRDQHARRHLDSGGSWGAVRRVDSDNTTWLDEVITENGWPGHGLVGVDGAHAAWLLAQHAQPEHQRRWLPLLRAAVQCDDAQPRDLAYLEDRVHTHEGRLQHYGTQWFSKDGRNGLFPIADRSGINLLRSSVGLSPLAEHDLDTVWQREELATLFPTSWGHA